MRKKNSGMLLNEKEADLIDLYRQKNSAQKRDTRKRVSEMYNEKNRSSKKRR